MTTSTGRGEVDAGGWQLDPVLGTTYAHIVEHGSVTWNSTRCQSHQQNPPADPKGPAVTSPNGTQAVDRAAQLLLEVVRCPDPVSFTALTASTGLAKSTTSRLLMALERNGLIRRDQGGRFLPGEAFISYAWRGDAESDLVSVAQPILEELGAQTGETVNLGVARGSGMVVQIAQVDSRYLIGGTNWVGQSVPLHGAALGKALLAYAAAELPDGR